ncbi:MAG: hypothetical protein K6E31_04540 [bacterium]|nr:hypothetical protein [bacterium]
MKKIILSIFVLILTGCVAKDIYNYYPEEKYISYGNPREVKTVLVGDSIIHMQKEIITDLLEVENHISSNNIVVPKGRYLKIGEDNDSIYFSLQTVKGRYIVFNGFPQHEGYLSYKKSSNKFYINDVVDLIKPEYMKYAKILKNQRMKNVNRDFFFRSLDYGGSKNNLISFIYREGDNQQRMTHDASQSRVFSYQGAKIEIIEYDQNSVTCKIISKFDVFD